jgi:hypothetical protein
MKRCLFTFLILFASTPVLGQERFSTVEERMTGKEFSETGLSKLTPEELAALNQWLRSHSVATLEDARYAPGAAMTAAATGDLRGFEDRPGAGGGPSGAIISGIVGEFGGWSEDGTVIELENGMVWKTAESTSFYLPAQEGRVAEIDQTIFGGWRLKVEGYSKTVAVKRLK